MNVTELNSLGPDGMRKIHIIPVSEWHEIPGSRIRTQPQPLEVAYLNGKPVRIQSVTVSVDSRGEPWASVKLVAP